MLISSKSILFKLFPYIDSVMFFVSDGIPNTNFFLFQHVFSRNFALTFLHFF